MNGKSIAKWVGIVALGIPALLGFIQIAEYLTKPKLDITATIESIDYDFPTQIKNKFRVPDIFKEVPDSIRERTMRQNELIFNRYRADSFGLKTINEMFSTDVTETKIMIQIVEAKKLMDFK